MSPEVRAYREKKYKMEWQKWWDTNKVEIIELCKQMEGMPHLPEISNEIRRDTNVQSV